MIGSRCLGPSGPATATRALRSSRATHAPSAPSAPLAECSYHVWQPPQHSYRSQEHARFPRASRSFATDSHKHGGIPAPSHTAASLDSRGYESFVHDPPFAKAKVKRLRPMSDTIPGDTRLAALDPNTKADILPDIRIRSRQIRGSDPTQGSQLHTPDRAEAGLQSKSRVDPSLLLKYLTTTDVSAKQRIKSHLPSDLLQIDAYLLLRESDPQSLSALSPQNIYALLRYAGKESLGGVLALLLQDIVGAELSDPKGRPGLFQIYAGTTERYRLLREVLIQCTRCDFLIHDGAVLKVFLQMLHDLSQMRQAGSHPTETNPLSDNDTTPASFDDKESNIVLPESFPVGEARRLVKLALRLGRPELLPIVQALRTHLEAHTPEFPTAREGAQLIAYYLQPNVRDFEAGLDVVRALRDTNAVSQDLIDDAIRDGREYYTSLRAAFSSNTEDMDSRPSAEDLEKVCLEVSLRLVGMKCVMLQLSNGGIQYRKALESLLTGFRFDLVDLCQQQPDCDLRSLLDVPVRNVRTILQNLVQSDSNNNFTELLSALQRCDPRIIALLPNGDLQEFCDAALARSAIRQANEIYALFVKARTTSAWTTSLPLECRHILARDGCLTSSDTFISMMRGLLGNGQRVSVIAVLRSLGMLPLTEAAVRQLNARFVYGQRSRLISLLADVGLSEDAFTLFQHWTQRRFEADLEFDAALGVASTFRSPGAVKVADPLVERQVRLMHYLERQTGMSGDCLVALVRSLCSSRQRTAANAPPALDTANTPTPPPAEEQLQKARFVVEVFVQSCTPVDWTHYRLTALARACFLVKDVPGAFYALAQISFLREVPDQVDVAVLLGGLMGVDADRAVELFIQHATVPENIKAQTGKHKFQEEHVTTTGTKRHTAKVVTIAPMRVSPALVSSLINRAIALGRMDLTDRLYAFSKAMGISSKLDFVASLRALYLPDIAPNEVVKTIDLVRQNGWTPDPGLLDSLAQRLLQRARKRNVLPLHSTQEDAGEGRDSTVRFVRPLHERLGLVRAATNLMRISAEREVVNLASVRLTLETVMGVRGAFARPANSDVSIAKTEASSLRAKERDQERRRLQWIAVLDGVVHTLRWAKFFDTGDDYRQSLPLWKSSKAGDGQLVPAELDELVDLGFPLIRRRRPTSGRGTTSTAPALNTPPGSEDVSRSQNAADMVREGVPQRFGHRLPNALPVDLFCRLIEAYLALADVAGAAEVASWMRDEVGMDIDHQSADASAFVDRIKAAVRAREGDGGQLERSSILCMLAGQQGTAHTKGWWNLHGH